MEGNTSPIFWLPLLALVALQGWEVIASKRKDATQVFFLVVCIVLVGILCYPEAFQLPGYDIYSEASYAQLIADTGKWNPTLGVGFAENYYGYYPCIHLILSTLSLVAGVPVLFIAKYIAPMAISVSVLAAARSMLKRCLLVENLGACCLVYVSSLGFMAVFTSRRVTALILGLLVIAMLSWEPRDSASRRSRVIALAILMAALAFSDHFMGPLVLLSAIASVIVMRIGGKTQMGSTFLLVGVVMYVGWMIFAALNIFGFYVQSVEYLLKAFFGTETTSSSLAIGYSGVESTITLSSWGLFGLLAFAGLVSWAKTRKLSRYGVWGTIGFVLFSLSTVLASLASVVVSITLTWLAAPFVGALASPAILGLSRRLPRNFAKIGMLVLLMVLFSGAMLSAYGARVLNRSPNQNCMVEDVSGFSYEQLALGKWVETHSNPRATVLGDSGSYVLLSGIYGTKFVKDFSWPAEASVPHESEDFVLQSKLYFKCNSAWWKNTNPTLAHNLGGLNRLWDGGTWQLLSAPHADS